MVKSTPLLKRKLIEEDGSIIEFLIWEVPKSEDKPQGLKYSLVYIVDGKRVVGYDNGERKGDHKHLGSKEFSYQFSTVPQLFLDFQEDIKKFKEKNNEN